LRDSFVKSLTEFSKKNKKIIILSGDIGNRMFDNFKSLYPKRFHNCGIAEANMVSLASGLASTGFLPFVYTITPFITTRCHEQIKIGISYHNYPVTIVGTGSGLSYAELGPTHHSFEDISIFRSLPHMRILTPGDPSEVRDAIALQLKDPKPTYIRLGKKGEPALNFLTKFNKNKIRYLQKGNKTLLLSCGNITLECTRAIKELNDCGIYLSHAHVNSIKPFNSAFLKEDYKNIISVEEHSIYGGLASTIAELKSKFNYQFNHYSLAIHDKYIHKSMSQDMARKYFKISSSDIIKLVKKIHD